MEPRVWSRPAKAVLGVGGAGLVLGTLAFLAALFLHVAPANVLSQRYQAQVDAVVYPEFEQNWRLFAPNPVQQDQHLDARVQTIAAGRITTREWVDLTAQDYAAVRHDPAPGHVAQNLLRRAWDFYASTHPSGDGPADEERGRLAEEYLKRAGLARIGAVAAGERVLQVEFRLRTAAIGPPAWSREDPSAAVPDRVLPWWPVDGTDLRGLG
ncbi:hypothetical protein CFP65_3825 [Kitasatospora sp. MMS16-BH015]|uniref:DUF5819 family protein n=1 Tax=Kitasatospora sp. MMS16-BH015 TaxID=2018025 RepID=UPI000CA2DF3A|nr:DUF5819 family protein [Kitasatospora sp. MMS16-BH015]AUG78605.1 hypothetical protein CFP65_3825 [Kitasatospora sp. MMS16-BH015]